MRDSLVKLATEVEVACLLAGYISEVSNALHEEFLHLQLFGQLLSVSRLCPKLARRVQKSSLAGPACELAVGVASLKTFAVFSLIPSRRHGLMHSFFSLLELLVS